MSSDGDLENSLGARTSIGRRTFLGVATGPLLGSGASAASGAERIELVGEQRGWRGVAPSEIEGKTNPKLTLSAGTTYTLTWKNGDGKPHNVVIESESGDQIIRSDIVETRGATQTVKFTATSEMSTYFCEVHPTSMRGAIATGEETPTPEPRPKPTGGAAQSAIPDGATVGLERVAGGIASPVGFEVHPEAPGRAVVVSQIGLVHVLGSNGFRDDPFLDVRELLPAIGKGTWANYDERGLLSLAFHPDFAETRKVYARYSAPREDRYGHYARVSEFRATEDLDRVPIESERVIIDIPMPGPVHNGGDIRFGPDDGHLYISLGDGSDDNDVGDGHVSDWYETNDGGNGQDVEANLLGSILRIDVDGGSTGSDRNYGIPDDNPLVGRAGLDEHYAWGLRNPWRMAFDSRGRLFASDSGVALYEEVNLVEKGGNYGWNVKEGTHCFDAENRTESLDQCPDRTPPDVRGGEPLLDPIVEYPHRDDDGMPVGITTIGGFMYEGSDLAELAGTYVFSNFSTSFQVSDGVLFGATPPGDGDGLWSVERLAVSNAENGGVNRYVLSFGRGADGELYVLTNRSPAPRPETGEVYRLVPPDEASTALEPVGPGSPTETATDTTGTETPTTGETATESTASLDGTATPGDGAAETGFLDDMAGFGLLAGLTGLALVYSYFLSSDPEE